MKTIAAFLIALLLVASPAVAQSSLEADMREAAAAYERKDMATAARLWKIWADKGNAEARTLLGAMYWSGEGVHRDHKEAARLYLLAANPMSRPTSGSRSPLRVTRRGTRTGSTRRRRIRPPWPPA